MADVLTLIAAIEWIALGIFVLYRLSRWNKKMQELYNELSETIKEGFNE